MRHNSTRFSSKCISLIALASIFYFPNAFSEQADSSGGVTTAKEDQEKKIACDEAYSAQKKTSDQLEAFKLTNVSQSVKAQVKEWESLVSSYRDKSDSERTKEDCAEITSKMALAQKDLSLLTPSKSDPNASSITSSLKFITDMRPSVGLEYFNHKFIKDPYVNNGIIYADERGHLASALWLSDNRAIPFHETGNIRFLTNWGLKLADSTGQTFNGLAMGGGIGFLFSKGSEKTDSDGVTPSINFTLNAIWHRYETLQEGFELHQKLPDGFTEVKSGHKSSGGVMLLMSYGMRL